MPIKRPLNTALSGNEMYCLHQKGMEAGELVIGNSVWSMGFGGALSAGLKTLAGGEVHEVTQIIHDGRQASFDRMCAWTDLGGAIGITGVTSELIQHGVGIEFLSVGSCVHRPGVEAEHLEFSTSADGQDLFCQLDAGYHPRHFAFGNVAYSIGIGGGIRGAFRSFARGEVHEYSEIFNKTRHLALERIKEDAKRFGANCVLGINTSIVPFGGMQEMLMIGTASTHDLYGQHTYDDPVTSDLTCQEMWNLAQLGYMPRELVLGVSVYSLGIVGGFSAFFKSFSRGEINELTSLVYEARENALHHINVDAERVGADDVVGIKTYVYELGGGMIEFMAIGTAIQKVDGIKTQSAQLPPQAVMHDKDTFFNAAEKSKARNLNDRDFSPTP